MDRQETVETLLRPLDKVLGAALEATKRSDAFETVSSRAYLAMSKALRKQLELMNELEIEGAHNVPLEGGVILASNHQSLLDAQILVASCPRRLFFLGQSKWEELQVLRHLIELSQSILLPEEGDASALQSIVRALEEKKAVAMFPEGAILGEKDAPRQAVDPRTGLLPCKTEIVRLAIETRAPIIPVGLSGTGKAFPPEAYPRLGLLRQLTSTPIRVRFGRPILLSGYHDKDIPSEQIEELKQEVMESISALVDHRRNYVPIDVPVPEAPKYGSIGVLLLHGFTSSTDTVDGLIPHLEKADIPYERPVLRGHGTRYQDLKGVTARDWYNDAKQALLKLSNRVDRVVVVGLSMGGLVTLDLAARHPDKIAGIVTVAGALRFKDPLVALTPLLAKTVRYWPSPPSFHDPLRASSCTNYDRFPTSAFLSLYRYSKEIEKRLPDVHVPTLVLAARQDQLIAPEAASIIHERISSPIREIEWFDKTGHEMMQDMEAEAVFGRIMNFVNRFKTAKKRSQRVAPKAKPTSQAGR